MRPSEALCAVVTLLAGVTLSGCGSYGDPCLRTTDCNTGFICSEGRCIVDLGDSPSDASTPPSDSTTTSDANVSKDTSVSSDTRTTPDGDDTTEGGDASGPDSKNDVRADGSPDVRDVGNETSADAADVRVLSDTTMTIDAGGDVGSSRDSGSASDASDASDAAG